MSQSERVYAVKWSNDAKHELKSIYDYIKHDSIQNAKLVMNRILETSRSLRTMPERYEIYEPMRNIPGNFRVKEIFSYLLIYDVTPSEVHIVKLMHVKEQK